MAVDRLQWQMIVAAGCKGNTLSAGYPDLLISKSDIQASIKEGNGEIRERADSQKVQEHHGYAGRIYDSKDVFAAIGLRLDVIDREMLHGSECVVDLNTPAVLGAYDLVIDPGTSEHCFNIAQALVNLADAVKVGGAISQGLPMSMFNHGYWNVNPVALIDLYEANGFKIERMLIRHKDGNFEPKLDALRQRLAGVPEGAAILLTARRLERRSFRWPQQAIPVVQSADLQGQSAPRPGA